MENPFIKILAGGAVAVILMMSLVSCNRVPAGNVGVVVNNMGTDKGVEETYVLDVGWWPLPPWKSLYVFPTFMQNFEWKADAYKDESISFQSVEGMKVSADIGISYQIDKTKANLIFQTYRLGIEEISNIYLRNMVRDALVTESSGLPIEAVYGRGKADLMRKVEEHVKSQVSPVGININRVYWVGDIRLPDTVKKALDAKIEATQMAQQRQNEIATAKAEADKKIEEARGIATSIELKGQAQARANDLVAKSLTDALVKYKALEVWDGALPRINSGVVPFINVDKEANATKN